MRGGPGSVGGDGAPVACCGGLGCPEPRTRAVAKGREERAIGRLRPVPHHAGERVEQDDGASLDQRRLVAPQAKRVAEPERCRGDRVEGLARDPEPGVRERHDDRVELPLEPYAEDD